MKILYVLNKKTTGGVEKVVLISAEELIKKGHEVSILFLQSSYDKTPLFENLNIPLITIQEQGFNKVLALRKIFKQYQIVHNHTFGAPALTIWCSIIGLRRSLITTIHSSFGLTGQKRFLLPTQGNRLFFMYWLFDLLFKFLGKAVIAVSPYVSNIVINSISIRKKRVYVVQNVVYANANILKPLLQREKNIIVVGRLAREKRIHLVIESMEQIVKTDADWHLNIIGSGEYENDLKLLVKKFGIEKSVHFLGETDAIYDYLGNAQIAVSASSFEGAPLSIIEFMHAGLPIVASNIDAHVDMQIDRFGFLFANQNNELTSCLLKLIKDENLRNLLGIRAKLESEKYELSLFAEKLEKIYTQFI